MESEALEILTTVETDVVESDPVLSEDEVSPRPFVKWAGGKGQLLPELVARVPKKYGRYFEPFVGGGALFFKLRPRQAFLSDLNHELIRAYRVIKFNVEELIKDLERHVYEKEYFYRLRDLGRADEYHLWSDIQKVSRFIYLNKTCFNGLYRVNSRGHFNVPFGKYTNPKILDAVNLRACSRALQETEVQECSFEYIERVVRKGDFVYCDPPYSPLSDTSNFTGYSKEGFDQEMQEKLRDFCVALDKKGVYFMLSNSCAPVVKDLYAGFHLEEVQAMRAINSKGSGRGRIPEAIVSNYLPQEK